MAMEHIVHVDWGRLLVPQLSLLEMLVHGVATYLGLCLLLRVVLRRQAGKVGLGDLLVVMLVAGICRNPLVADAYSLTDGLGVVAVVLGCSYLLDAASYYLPLVKRFMEAAPVQLIRDGRILSDNLHHEMMTESQLRSKLRGHGVGEPGAVAEAWMEGNGEVSVLTKADEGATTDPTATVLLSGPRLERLLAATRMIEGLVREAEAEQTQVARH
jgi:uncharacterized membrane protein YcaP (DUF421 family)